MTSKQFEIKDAVTLIAEERNRQITQEGWTPEHDDEHDGFELSAAATYYIRFARCSGDELESLGHERLSYHVIRGTQSPLWPWALSWWKPSKDRVRNLVKAGALIAAEIDRLQRCSCSDTNE